MRSNFFTKLLYSNNADFFKPYTPSLNFDVNIPIVVSFFMYCIVV